MTAFGEGGEREKGEEGKRKRIRDGAEPGTFSGARNRGNVARF